MYYVRTVDISRDNFENGSAVLEWPPAGARRKALQAEARAVHRAVMEKVKWHKEMQCMQFFYVIGVKGLSDEEKAELKDEQKARGDLVWINEDHMSQGVASRDWFLHAHERFPKAWLIGKGNLDTFVHPANLFDQ